MIQFAKTGVVVIGRNEGDRLKRCIESVVDLVDKVVYVDSGSTDHSVDYCRDLQIEVVELDTSIPFSAARARNAGMDKLIEVMPDLNYIQFVDGDCEVAKGWVSSAADYLNENSGVAIVCGRRRERFPEQSVYNLLCNMEWNTAVGFTRSCGGDFLARPSAMMEVSGFNPFIVAGEEPDLCYRLRKKNWKIFRLDHEMTLHDAMILEFNQWWKRTLRSGHAFAQNMILHWGDGALLNVRNVASILIWGLAVPIGVVLSLTMWLYSKYSLFGWVALSLSVLLILSCIKIMIRTGQKLEVPRKNAIFYGFFTQLGKLPQAIGVMKFIRKWIFGQKVEIIEYQK